MWHWLHYERALATSIFYDLLIDYIYDLLVLLFSLSASWSPFFNSLVQRNLIVTVTICMFVMTFPELLCPLTEVAAIAV